MIPKFRAWIKKDKEMIAVEEIHFNNGELDFIGDAITWMCKNNDFVLMQLTGLTDSAGKEIFEGDVLKFNDSWDDCCYEGYVDGEIEGVNYVEIQSESTGFIFCKTKYPDSSLFYYANEEHLTFQEILTDSDFEFEVIGNIYENPELVEVKK